jgi:hypothetical protein
MSTATRVRLHNITSRVKLNYGSEIWILNKKERQKLEAAETIFRDQYWASTD